VATVVHALVAAVVDPLVAAVVHALVAVTWTVVHVSMAAMTLGSRSGVLGEEFGGGGSLLRVTAVVVGVEQAGVCFVQSSTHFVARVHVHAHPWSWHLVPDALDRFRELRPGFAAHDEYVGVRG
ncbi:hypothetical protein, partial [Nocardioides salarius]|uniref:hypothetical protein n=1 Tax=Nocardioides salarius TaxID=374513 RepID=UPI0030F68A7F